MKQLISVALSLLCLAISIPSIKAEENGRFPKNLFVEFGVGFLSYGDKILPSKAKNTMLTPIIGYKFHPRWAAGFGVTFPIGKEHLYKPMPALFLSYDFLQINKFSTFAQLQGTYGKNPTIRWLDSMEGGTPRVITIMKCNVIYGNVASDWVLPIASMIIFQRTSVIFL